MSLWRRRRQSRLPRPKAVSVEVRFPLVGVISGTWEPREAERKAAAELYVEIVTRTAGTAPR